MTRSRTSGDRLDRICWASLERPPRVAATMVSSPLGGTSASSSPGKQHRAAGVDNHDVRRDGLQLDRIAAAQAGVGEDRVKDLLMGGGDPLSPDDALAGSIVKLAGSIVKRWRPR
jgi:hypothetical protein